MTPALTRAAIISPFQSARILSSRPGRTLVSRLLCSIGRSMANRCSSSMLRGKLIESIENIMALEIAPGAYVVKRSKECSIFRAQDLLDLLLRPDIEFALFALGIGIERSAKAAFPRGHFAFQPAHGLKRAFAEYRVTTALKGQRQQLQKLGIVVEHLLEMRHQPALVDRIARKAAAEMVVDAALAHALEAECSTVSKKRASPVRMPARQSMFQNGRLRKLGRPAQAAVDGIEHIADLLRGAVELVEADGHFAGRPRLVGEPRQQRYAVLLDLLRLLAEQPRHFAAKCR